MSYPGGWRPHLESAHCLDLRRMFACRALRPGLETSGTLQWTRDGETFASIGYRATLSADAGTLALKYSQHDRATGESRPITCTVRLVTLPRHYGGRIWYFVCPCTGRRARKLYKWARIDWFCHREAVTPKPTYACQRVGGSDRINAQRWALRRKLNDTITTLFDEPMKPKWMRWRTFDRYVARDAELTAREWGCFARVLAKLEAPGFDVFRR